MAQPLLIEKLGSPKDAACGIPGRSAVNTLRPCGAGAAPSVIMNKTQTAKTNSYQAITGIFASHPTEVASIPALRLGVERFTDNMLGIDTNAKTQASPSGAGKAKQIALLTLVDCSELVAGAVHSLAEDNEDAELTAQVDFSRSDLLAGSGAAIVARARGIYDTAKEYLADLAPHGVTQAKLTAFSQAIKTYDNLRSTPRQARAAKAAATKQLARLVPKADRILSRTIDKLMVQFKSANPEFYDKYQTARSVVVLATRAAKTEESTAPKAKAA